MRGRVVGMRGGGGLAEIDDSMVSVSGHLRLTALFSFCSTPFSSTFYLCERR